VYGPTPLWDAVSELDREGKPWSARIRRVVLRPQDDRAQDDANRLIAAQIADDVTEGAVDVSPPDVLMVAVLRYLANGGSRHGIAALDLYVPLARRANARMGGGGERRPHAHVGRWLVARAEPSNICA
jgi:hypothetical protein